MGTVPAKREKRADAVAGSQTFRSPTAVIVWWAWLLFAAANLVDLAVQGRDHTALVAAAILLLATGVAYVTAQRPRLIADDGGITIRNPLFDHHVGWAGVTQIDLADLLRVHCAPRQPGQRGKVIGAWAVHYSRRHRLVAQTRTRRASARAGSRRSSPGLPYGDSRGFKTPAGPPVSAAEEEAEKIARQLSERAIAARAEAVWAEGTAPIAGAGQAADAAQAGHAADVAQAGQATRAAPAVPAAGSESAAWTEVAGQPGMDLRGTGWLEPLTSTLSRRALAALIIPALILLVVCLI